MEEARAALAKAQAAALAKRQAAESAKVAAAQATEDLSKASEAVDAARARAKDHFAKIHRMVKLQGIVKQMQSATKAVDISDHGRTESTPIKDIATRPAPADVAAAADDSPIKDAATPQAAADVAAAASDSVLVGGAVVGYDSDVRKRASTVGMSFGGIKSYSKSPAATPSPDGAIMLPPRRGSSGWTKKMEIDWSATQARDLSKAGSVKDIIAGMNSGKGVEPVHEDAAAAPSTPYAAAAPPHDACPPSLAPSSAAAAAPSAPAARAAASAPAPIKAASSDAAESDENVLVGAAALGLEDHSDARRRASTVGMTFGGIKAYSKSAASPGSAAGATPSPQGVMPPRRGSSGWTKKMEIDWSATRQSDLSKAGSVKDLVANMNRVMSSDGQ